jgi:hypothetical protein
MGWGEEDDEDEEGIEIEREVDAVEEDDNEGYKEEEVGKLKEEAEEEGKGELSGAI